jgi:predicted O-methyltransferase YrrM
MRPALKTFKKCVGTKIVTAIEIGVAAGKYAQEIHDNLRCKRLYLVDTWHSNYRPIIFDWMKEACRRFENDKRVIIIKASSLEAWRLLEREKPDFIYLDGNHNYEHVLQELKIYGRLLNKGGMIAGHDYDEEHPDRVARAVGEWAKENKHKVYFGDIDWWVWK